ncbi:hypothetical protein D3C84_710860 [compost metagenome]
MSQTHLRRRQLLALKQLRGQHLAVTQRGGQIAQRLRRALQLLDAWQLTQRSQQAAQATRGNPQVMQCLAVGVSRQPCLASEQANLQGQYLGNHMVKHG